MVRSTVAILVLLICGCSDPTALREVSVVNAMQVFMILDPDSASQAAFAMPVTTSGTLEDISATLFNNDFAVANGTSELDNLDPCVDVYGTTRILGAVPSCITFDLKPDFNATYRLEISAFNRPPIHATTTVPGDFSIITASARGNSPPGTAGLEVSWSRSEGAYAYLVALRATIPPWCAEFQSCVDGVRFVDPDRQGWFAVTRDTVLITTVAGEGAEESAGGIGPWYVDVYAVSRSLHDYLTTGSTSEIFPVPPAQNVEGGYGAVGALVWRSYRLPE